MPAAWVAATSVFFAGLADVVEAGTLRVATFRCDVTPPLGEPMISCDIIRTIDNPLLAKGIVLESDGQRYVLCAVDWCELCNGSYDSLRRKLAVASGTRTEYVALQTVHQHTAPLVDIEAQRILADAGAAGLHLSLTCLTEIENRVADAARESLDRFVLVDQIGAGEAVVERVASSRRPRDESGTIRPRGSFGGDTVLQRLPEGTIDPYLKTITLARGREPVVRLHYYATHPQTKYGDGRASSDIVGKARESLEAEERVFQVYFTGCGGDITVGKYNDGTASGRQEMADRLLAGMKGAVTATRLAPVDSIRWRTYPLVLPRRADPGFTMADCLARVKDEKVGAVARFYSGAIRAAFLQHTEQPIDLTSLEIGRIHILHLPGEPMIDFQFDAQRLKPGEFVAVAGYGDCGPGYLCPEQAFHDGGYEPTESCVKPESEVLLKKAIAALLGID